MASADPTTVDEAHDDGIATGEAEEESSKGQEKTNKRPRYNDKAFADLTVSELEGAVREANALRTKCAKKDEELALLKDVKSDKSAVLQKVRGLEKELAAAQAEANKLKQSEKDKQVDIEKQITNVKNAIKKTLKDQMHYDASMKDQLKAGGYEIIAYVANVSDAVLKGMQIEPGAQNAHIKYSTPFFGDPVSKASSGGKLVLDRNLNCKYVKATQELQVHAKYKFEGARATSPKKRKAAKLENGENAEEEAYASGDDETARDTAAAGESAS